MEGTFPKCPGKKSPWEILQKAIQSTHGDQNSFRGDALAILEGGTVQASLARFFCVQFFALLLACLFGRDYKVRESEFLITLATYILFISKQFLSLTHQQINFPKNNVVPKIDLISRYKKFFFFFFLGPQVTSVLWPVVCAVTAMIF